MLKTLRLEKTWFFFKYGHEKIEIYQADKILDLTGSSRCGSAVNEPD